MKKLFFYHLLIAFTLAFFTIMSCSKDANTANNSEIVEETLLSRQLTNPDITDFLDDYYKTTYTFGDTEEVYEDNDIFEVTEVFVSSTLPVGYVVTERYTEDFLYFANFDRDNETVEAFDIKENESMFITELPEDENGKTLLDYDILEYVKDTFSERRFWGWSCGAEYELEPGSCYRNCTYYVLWTATPVEFTAYPEPVFTCSNLPGNNPRLDE